MFELSAGGDAEIGSKLKHNWKVFSVCQ